MLNEIQSRNKSIANGSGQVHNPLTPIGDTDSCTEMTPVAATAANPFNPPDPMRGIARPVAESAPIGRPTEKNKARQRP